jgi:hypothetical protein
VSAAPVIDGVCRLIANHHDLAIFESAPEVGSFAPPALPSLSAHMIPSDCRHGRRLRDVEAATLALDGPPPITRTTFPRCRAHNPGGSRGCACRLLTHACSPSPNDRRVGVRISRPARASLCYGPSDRTAAQGRLCRRAPTQPVIRVRPSLTDSSPSRRTVNGVVLTAGQSLPVHPNQRTSS